MNTDKHSDRFIPQPCVVIWACTACYILVVSSLSQTSMYTSMICVHCQHKYLRANVPNLEVVTESMCPCPSYLWFVLPIKLHSEPFLSDGRYWWTLESIREHVSPSSYRILAKPPGPLDIHMEVSMHRRKSANMQTVDDLMEANINRLQRRITNHVYMDVNLYGANHADDFFDLCVDENRCATILLCSHLAFVVLITKFNKCIYC